MILPIVHAPDPRLKEKSREVLPSEFGPALADRMSDMTHTMLNAPGAGLAGIQVGDARRILIATIGGVSVPMVNPVLSHKSKLMATDREGCLSFPSRFKPVTRPRQIVVTFKTPFGEDQELRLSGFDARCVQHEMDHLDGKTIF